MTLITLHSRIHFASNILEDALRAEVESQQSQNALLIYPEACEGGEFLARVEAGLDSCMHVTSHAISPSHSKYDTAERVLALPDDPQVDLIVAMGSAETIAHSRKCRQGLASQRYAAQGHARSRVRGQDLGPSFFVIPGIDGLPDPCLEANGSVGIKTAPPNVIICDPTVIGPAADRDLARVIAQAMGRSMTALTAETFNPLADGMAIDALTRLQGHLFDHPPRDLMAATLNGAIALQKGPGLVEAFRFSFAKAVGRDLDSALLHRVLLARMLGSTRSGNCEVIGRVLGMPAHKDLPDFVAALLEDFPLPDSLSDIGLGWEEVEQTLDYMEPRFGAPQLRSSREMRQVLQDVF